MEHMVHSESDKFKSDLFEGLKNKFGDKLDREDFEFISKSFETYISEMIKLMREGKSVHEKFFSDIILNSVDGIIGYNAERRIFLWNKGAEILYGYGKEEVMGRDISIIVPEENIKNGMFEGIQKEIEEKGFISGVDTRGRTKSGGLKEISLSQHVIFDEKGDKLGTVAIIRDMTHVKELERELRDKENLALIGQVVSSIAHNLSNPLNIISGNADYLLLDKKSGEEGYDELKVIVDETTRITKSIRSILNFARPLAPMREETTFNELVEEAASGFKFLTGSKTTKLKLNLEKTPHALKLDRGLFKDLLLNLIGNSIQAIPADKQGLIEITTATEGGKSVLTIKDNGMGISKSDLQNIFKPFFTTKGYGKGTGLGLSFAQRVVKEHDGTINVTSVEGKSTTFSITL